MNRGFGWSLPPGCGTLPGEEPEAPCGLCGNYADDCKCEECPECGTVGCVSHLSNSNLLIRFWAAEAEVKKRGGEAKLWHDTEGCYGDPDCQFCKPAAEREGGSQ